MVKLLFIFLGGGLGSLLRYLMAALFSKYLHSAFPISTLVINVSGCFLIGLFYAWYFKYHAPAVLWQQFLITGFCGGFTTFSAFAYENINLLQAGSTLLFIAYTVSSILLTLLAVVAGMSLVKLL